MEHTHHQKNIPKINNAILTADIGGTNSRFGVFQRRNNRLILLVTFTTKTTKIHDLKHPIKHVIDHCKNHGVRIYKIGIGMAGEVKKPMSPAKLTNGTLKVYPKKLSKTLNIPVVALNDFHAVALSIGDLPKKYFLSIQPGRFKHQKSRLVIGAGTGLGVAVLKYNTRSKSYSAIATELGNREPFLFSNELEFELVQFLKKKTIVWEDFVSGGGISRIYKFLLTKEKETRNTKVIQNAKYDPAIISKYRTKDTLCKKTFQLFFSVYAKALRHYVLKLDTYGGIYIAGGVAQKNILLLKQKLFIGEFINHPTKQLLQKIPITLITNQFAGLYGAAVAALSKKRGKV
jgi:glucokinase